MSVSSSSITHHCFHCPFHSSSRWHVNRHIQEVHKKTREYACEKCNFIAKRPEHLRRHQKEIHHKEKLYACEECSFTTYRESRITDHHARMHHGGNLECVLCLGKCHRLYSILVHGDEVMACIHCRAEWKQRPETRMSNYLDDHFEGSSYLIASDQSLCKSGGCSKYRPDKLYMIPHNQTAIVVECDEKQHRNAKYECEESRTCFIYDVLSRQCKRVVFVRWNPDGYKSLREKADMNTRLEKLLQVMHTIYRQKRPKTKVHYLYYSRDNHTITQQFPTAFYE